jgi:hypothetical protein
LKFNGKEMHNLSEPMGAKGEVIAMNVYVKNIERSQINYLMLHL